MILVTGAGGNVGGALARLLVEAGEQVRGLVTGRSGRDDSLPGVEMAVGDLAEPRSIVPALANVRRAFLLGGYGDIAAVLQEFVRAGVEHVVLLSSRSAIGGNPANAIANMWMAVEAAARSSGMPWTIVRPSGFMTNALQWAPQIRTGDLVRAPFAKAAVAAIDPRDIAAVAAAILTSDGHRSRAYQLSGSAALRPADSVAILGRVLQRPLRFEEQSEAETRAELRKTTPPAIVDAFFRFFVDGEFDDLPVVPTVQDILGRPPRTFEEWAMDHAARFS